MERNDTSRPAGLDIGKNNCIWMTAGVVRYKLCEMNYDCMNCPFDKAMGKKIGKESPLEGIGANWRRIFNALPEEKRYCRHMLNKHVGYKLCGNGFMCHKCEFDQLIEEEMATLDPLGPSLYRTVEGFLYPDNYYYHRGHAYAMVDYGGRIRVGLDDFSTRLVGVADAVEVPQLGEAVRVNETGWSLRREGNEAEMMSPINGIVSAVNYKAIKNPEMINLLPYEKGWLYMVEPLNLKRDLKNLLFGEETINWVQLEFNRLRTIMNEELGPTASAGGLLTRDLYGALRGVGWDRLTREFLLSY